MNYLAHAYLSFGNPKILVGNLIADLVKGKQMLDFGEEIRKGITIHREIDDFTDSHAIVKDTKTLFRRSASRYDGLFLDIAFDHFLAIDTEREPPKGWMYYTQWCYSQIEEHMSEFPSDFKRLFGYMVQEDWLYNYKYSWMIEKSFSRMTRRAAFLPDNANVFFDFKENYTAINEAYKSFFPDLENFVKEHTDTIFDK